MGAIETIESMGAFTKAAYAKIAEKGGDVPSDQNIAGLGEAIRSISTTPPYDPSNPTLDGIKLAMQAGDYSSFPAGTEIPDTYAGNSNPLIVAQYLDSSNNSAYGGAEGVILVRKYVEPTSQMYSTASIDYNTSLVKNYLDTTYLANCSDALKGLISNITVTYNDGGKTATGKFFIMSNIEVCAQWSGRPADGIMFDYWKQQTGLSSPDNTANGGRIMRDRNGTATKCWLRSYRISSDMCIVYENGKIDVSYPYSQWGVLPACFIAK